MLPLLPLPANPPRRLAMRNFQHPSTNLGPPSAPPPDGPLTAHRRPTTSLPAPAPFGNARTTKPGQTSGLQQPRQLTTHGPPTTSLPAPTPFANPMTTDAGQTSDLQQPRQLTTHGPPTGSLPPRSPSGQGGNLPPRHPDTPRAFAIFTSRHSSGALPPTCPPLTGHKSPPPLLPLLPLPANSGSVPRQDAPLPS
jgi:hypothetical protein